MSYIRSSDLIHLIGDGLYPFTSLSLFALRPQPPTTFLLCLYECDFFFSIFFKGVPWWSSGQDSVLSLLWAQVQSLVRELGSWKPCGVVKNFFFFLAISDTLQYLSLSGLFHLA